MLDISQRVASLKPSQIREVAEEGMTMPDVIPLWFGESAWPTSDIAVKAASDALSAGDHFYQPNSGRPSLRDAIVDYQQALYGQSFSRQQITVTASAMQGLVLSAQALLNTGDRVVIVEPAWPNMAECFRLVGADVVPVALRDVNGHWTLDLDELLDSIGRNTRVVAINSPSNPTGWVMSEAEQQAVLEHCRQTGTWIVADDVYARLYKHARAAPGFLSLATADDQLLVLNSFSKAWSMTGWRLGWISAPANLEATFAMLSEYNIAGPAGFVQQAGETMLKQGEPDIELLQQRLQTSYEMIESRLGSLDRVKFVQADGAFYAFFSVEDASDSLSLAKTLLHEAHVGVAPGVAFGESGEGYLRLCYAQPESVLAPALDRLVKALA